MHIHNTGEEKDKRRIEKVTTYTHIYIHFLQDEKRAILETLILLLELNLDGKKRKVIAF